jgi:hypothetical protein
MMLSMLPAGAAREAPCGLRSGCKVPRLSLPAAPSARHPSRLRRGVPPSRSVVSTEGSFDADALDIDNLELAEDPYGTVGDVMTSINLRFATPDQPLSAAASKLDKVTGLAVVDENNVVVGVVSIKVSVCVSVFSEVARKIWLYGGSLLFL